MPAFAAQSDKPCLCWLERVVVSKLFFFFFFKVKAKAKKKRKKEKRKKEKKSKKRKKAKSKTKKSQNLQHKVTNFLSINVFIG